MLFILIVQQFLSVKQADDSEAEALLDQLYVAIDGVGEPLV